jgi:hypothetical protein
VNEWTNFQFRVEAYDFPNHPNLCATYVSGCSVGALAAVCLLSGGWPLGYRIGSSVPMSHMASKSRWL